MYLRLVNCFKAFLTCYLLRFYLLCQKNMHSFAEHLHRKYCFFMKVRIGMILKPLKGLSPVVKTSFYKWAFCLFPQFKMPFLLQYTQNTFARVMHSDSHGYWEYHVGQNWQHFLPWVFLVTFRWADSLGWYRISDPVLQHSPLHESIAFDTAILLPYTQVMKTVQECLKMKKSPLENCSGADCTESLSLVLLAFCDCSLLQFSG